MQSSTASLSDKIEVVGECRNSVKDFSKIYSLEKVCLDLKLLEKSNHDKRRPRTESRPPSFMIDFEVESVNIASRNSDTNAEKIRDAVIKITERFD